MSTSADVRSLRMLVAAAGLAVAVLAVSLPLLAARIDGQSARREQALAEADIAGTAAYMISRADFLAVWDEFLLHTDAHPDDAWMRANTVSWIPTDVTHQIAFVVDGEGRTLFAREQTNEIPSARRQEIEQALAPMIRNLRLAEAPTEGRRLHPLAYKPAPMVSGASTILIGGRPFLAIGSLIGTGSGLVGQVHAHAPVLLLASDFRSTVLPQMVERLKLAHARLLASSMTPAGAHIPLNDPRGRPVAQVVWAPQTPGRDLLLSVLLPVIGVVGGLSLLVLNTYRRARASAMQATAAMQAAELASVAKSSFLANMSHEIRTPLNGVLGMLQVMQMDELSAAQRERLGVVRESGETLLAILNDLLDLSKIEADLVELENTAFEVGDLVAGVLAAFDGVASAKGLVLTGFVSDEAAGVWIGDALRLRQVIGNLLSNAMKFTASGEVSLTADGDGDGLVFRVRDSGIGMTAEQTGRIFEKFAQADASITRRYGGTGLGLAICRDLVTLMGGRIWVSSVPGEGSTVCVELPLGRGEASAPEPAAVETEAVRVDGRARVLAAEDNLTNQRILRALLEALGVELTVVGDGRQAVDAFAAGAFDVVLMDVQMPEMNGVEATEAIRRMEADRGLAPTPIIALTANVMPAQIKDYMAAGMTDWVAKPIVLQRLHAALADALAGAPRTDASLAA